MTTLQLQVKNDQTNQTETALIHISRPDIPLVKRHLWHINKDGYLVRRTSRRVAGHKTPVGEWVFLHRVILDLPKGDQREGNHRSRDKLDVSRRNLEVLTHLNNMRHWMQQDGRMDSTSNIAGDQKKMSWPSAKIKEVAAGGKA